MKFYPVCLTVKDRLCVVVGGGEVGERKVEGLLECGARVVVVSRNLMPSLQRLKEEGRIAHIDLDYEASVLEGAFLVVGATDREDVNDRIARDARDAGILSNIADDPEKCDFILPALLRRGDLIVAVSTGGTSPALARKVRDEIEERIGAEYEILARIMGRLREAVLSRERSADENREIFRAVVASDVTDRIRRRDWDGVRVIIRELAGVDLVLEE
jgi:precorrin-2 dehydrogenase / sirohydrochlorin ferrochelatase